MLERLDIIERDFLDLESSMATPEVLGNQDKLRDVSRKYKQMTPLVECIRKYQKATWRTIVELVARPTTHNHRRVVVCGWAVEQLCNARNRHDDDQTSQRHTFKTKRLDLGQRRLCDKTFVRFVFKRANQNGFSLRLTTSENRLA